MICPPGRGGRLDRAGGSSVIADLFHQRDRERACGHDIARRCAVDHTHEARCENRHLGRAAARAPCRGESKVHEVITDLRGLQESREDDEQDDIGRTDRSGRSENARVGIDMAEKALPGIGALDGKDPGQQMRGEGIGKKDTCDDDQRKPGHPPRQLEDQGGAGRRGKGHTDGHEGRADRIARRGRIDRNEVERHENAAQSHDDIRGCHALWLAALEPAQDDGSERGDQQRCAIPPKFLRVDLCSGKGGPCHQAPHDGQLATVEPQKELDHGPGRDRNGDQQSITRQAQDWCLTRVVIRVHPVCGEHEKPQNQCPGDVHDAEIPGFHGKLRQKRQIDPGVVGYRNTVQRRHVERRIDDGEKCRKLGHQAGELSAIGFDRFLVDAFCNHGFDNF